MVLLRKLYFFLTPFLFLCLFSFRSYAYSLVDAGYGAYTGEFNGNTVFGSIDTSSLSSNSLAFLREWQSSPNSILFQERNGITFCIIDSPSIYMKYYSPYAGKRGLIPYVLGSTSDASSFRSISFDRSSSVTAPSGDSVSFPVLSSSNGVTGNTLNRSGVRYFGVPVMGNWQGFKNFKRESSDYCLDYSGDFYVHDNGGLFELPFYKVTVFLIIPGHNMYQVHSVQYKRPGESYDIACPRDYSGFGPDRFTVSGVMGSSDIVEYVYYNKRPKKLTVRYVHQDGSQAAPPVILTLYPGEPFNVDSPSIDEHNPDLSVVSGNMSNDDSTVVVTYHPVLYNLTLDYRFENGAAAAPSAALSFPAGASYRVPSPSVDGYTPDKAEVTGLMPSYDVSQVVVYHRSSYALTIHYQYTDGSQAAPDYLSNILYDEPYHVESPSISNYIPDYPIVLGSMPSKNLRIVVTYSKVSVPSEPDIPPPSDSSSEPDIPPPSDSSSEPDIPPSSDNSSSSLPEIPSFDDPFDMQLPYNPEYVAISPDVIKDFGYYIRDNIRPIANTFLVGVSIVLVFLLFWQIISYLIR